MERHCRAGQGEGKEWQARGRCPGQRQWRRLPPGKEGAKTRRQNWQEPVQEINPPTQ